MSGPEAIVALIGLGAAFWLTVKLLIWVLETLGRAVRAVAPFLLMALGVFVLFTILQADAANATTIAIPTGVVVASLRASLVGF